MTPGTYYNEHDQYLCAWLRNQMDRGLVDEGVIDDRPIEQVDAGDLAGIRRAHFFAGIGAWAHALDLAGWRDDQEVWTGSCPCGPFAIAGERRGFADDRDLWPDWYRLIGERRPSPIFGEQVASPLGREWLARTRSDLGDLGYAVGAACLPAAGAGAPHLRYRFFFGALADADRRRRGWRPPHEIDDDREGAGRAQDQRELGGRGAAGRRPWDGARWIGGPDGKRRRIGPGLRLLADGPASRSGRLRAYGNAIVPQVAAYFVRSFAEAAGLKACL
jgi:DNA (cytosine-5)-methyltransferase 1